MDLQTIYEKVAVPRTDMTGPGDGTMALPPQKKENWNNFIDYLDKAGYKGSAALDNRDTNLGKTLVAKYNTLYPKQAISYEDVPTVQAELQKYRQTLVDKWKAGKSTSDGVKSEDEIMPGLSKVDGWLGSKTSSYRFPVATMTHTDGTKQNFGVNTDIYDQLVNKK